MAQMAALARDEEAWWQAELARLAPQMLLPGRPVRGGGRAAGTGLASGLAIEVARLARSLRRCSGGSFVPRQNNSAWRSTLPRLNRCARWRFLAVPAKSWRCRMACALSELRASCGFQSTTANSKK